MRNLSSVLRQLATLEEEVATIEAAIVQLGKALPGLTQVLQLPGLNVLSGIGLLAEIGKLDWNVSGAFIFARHDPFSRDCSYLLALCSFIFAGIRVDKKEWRQ